MKRIVADRESDLIPGKASPSLSEPCTEVLSSSLKGWTETNEALEQIQCRGDMIYQT